MLRCPRCFSENVRVELVQKYSLKKGKGIWYWLTGYFIINWMMWLFFTPLKILLKLLKGPDYRLKTKTRKKLICNNCGYIGGIR